MLHAFSQGKRQRCNARAKAKKSIVNMTNGNDIVDDIVDDNNAIDIFAHS